MDVTWVVIAWIPHFSATLSIIGSSSIIYMILSDSKKKLAKPNHRIMLAMSAFDVLSSAALATSTWPYPQETLSYGSMGNMTTCKIQYFFVSLGLAVPMYNASLCLLYLSTIRYRLHQRHFATKIEPYLHTASVLIPLTIATVPVVMDDVSPAYIGSVCSINWDSPMMWPMVMVPSLSFCVCSYSLAAVCRHVRTNSNKMRRYSYGTTQMQQRQSEKNEVVHQAILYTAAFVITFVCPAISVIYYCFPAEIIKNTLFPLQGFWNFLLYIRPNVMKMKKTTPDRNLCEIIWSVVFGSKKRNEVSRQKQRKKENKHQLILDELKKNMDDANMNWNENSSEESKYEITADLTTLISVDQSRDVTSEDHRDISHAIEPTCCDESIERGAIQTISPLFATVDDDMYSLDERSEICAVPHASLVFATVDDEIYSHSSDSEESA